MGDSNVAAAMAFGQCPGPYVCRELSKRSFNFSVQPSARVRVWFMSLICGGLGSAEAIFAGMLTVDVTAPPPSRVAAPRSFTLASRRVRRKTSKAGGGDEGSEWFSDDGGDFGNLGGVYGSGGGGDSRRGWWYGWNGENWGSNWDDASDSAFNFVYRIACWISLSHCLHYAFKKPVRFVQNDVENRFSD